MESSYDKNDTYCYQLGIYLNKQILLINKKTFNDNRKKLYDICDKFIKLFKDKEIQISKKMYNNLLLKFITFLSLIIVNKNEIDETLMNVYIKCFQYVLLENNELCTEMITHKSLLLLNMFIVYNNEINNNDLISFYYGFVEKCKYRSTHTKLIFTILFNIYKKYYNKHVVQHKEMFTNILDNLVTISHESITNGNHNVEVIIYCISLLLKLCKNKYFTCKHLAKSYSFINFCTDLLDNDLTKRTLFQKSGIILELFTTVFDNEIKKLMFKIIRTTSINDVTYKISNFFPFVINFNEQSYNAFIKSCFMILRYLIQDENNYYFFADYLYHFCQESIRSNKYLESIFISFFYWNKLRNENNSIITLNDIIKSFTEQVLPKIQTPIRAYDKITLYESVSLIDFENEENITIIENYISSKKEDNYALNYLVKVIEKFPNNKRVHLILSEIPNGFLVNLNDNIGINSCDNLIKHFLYNIQTTFIRLIEEITKSKRYTSNNLNDFINYLNSFKICIMLKSSVDDNDDLSIQEQNVISNSLINSVCEIFQNFSKKVFKIDEYENYLEIMKLKFDLFAFIIGKSSSIELVQALKNGTFILDCLKFLLLIKNKQTDDFHYIAKIFFLNLFKHVKYDFIDDGDNVELIESLLNFIEVTLDINSLEIEIFEEIIEELILINNYYTQLTESLCRFYLRNFYLVKILKTIFSKRIITHISNNTNKLSTINKLLKFIYDKYFHEILNFLKTQESEMMFLSLICILQDLITENTVEIVNDLSMFIFIRLLKRILDFSNQIKCFRHKFWLYQPIYILFDFLEINIQNTSTLLEKAPLTSKQNTIIHLYMITTNLLKVYSSQKLFNFTDKEIFLFHNKIFSSLKRFLNKKCNFINEKILKNIIDLVIPNEIIEQDCLSLLSIQKSQLLLFLWNNYEYNQLLKDLLVYVFNSNNYVYVTCENKVNTLLANVGVMLTNAKKCYEIFILTQFKNKWLCSSFFKNNFLHLTEPSILTITLVLNIIRVLESSIIIHKKKIDFPQRISLKTSSRLSLLRERTSVTKSNMEIKLKENKEEVNFISQTLCNVVSNGLELFNMEEDLVPDNFSCARSLLSELHKSNRTLTNSKYLFSEEEHSEIGMISDEMKISFNIDINQKLIYTKEFCSLCDKIKEFELIKAPNLFKIRQINGNLCKIINNNVFNDLIQNEEIVQQIIFLLQMNERLCYMHTKLGLLLKLKLFIRKLNDNDNKVLNIMNTYFLEIFEKICQSFQIENSVTKLQYEVITLYVAKRSINFDFMKTNDSLLDINLLLNLIQTNKYKIEIIGNLLDIIKNLLKYLVKIENFKSIINNSQILLQILLNELTKTYPLLITIQSKILSIFVEIPYTEETKNLIQVIIDPFLSKTLVHVINYFNKQKISDIDFSDSQELNTTTENLLNIIHYYCCELPNNEYITLMFQSNKELLNQFLDLLNEYSIEKETIEKGFYIIEKLSNGVPQLIDTNLNKIISVLCVLLNRAYQKVLISDSFIIHIIVVINSLLQKTEKISSDFYSNTSILENLKSIFLDIDCTIIFINALNLLKTIIINYLIHDDNQSQNMDEFIRNEFAHQILGNYLNSEYLNTKIVKEISNILQCIVNSNRFNSLNDFFISFFLPESIDLILKNDSPNEIIEIYLSNILLFYQDINIFITHIHKIFNFLKEINQHTELVNEIIYQYLFSFASLIVPFLKLYNDKNHEEIFRQIFQDLILIILVKYNNLLDKLNIIGAITLLEELIQVNILEDLTFVYIINIFKVLENKDIISEIIPLDLINLYKAVFNIFARISKYFFEEDENNIKQFVESLKIISELLHSIFDEYQIIDNIKAEIMDPFLQGIKLIGMNNPLFLKHLRNIEFDKNNEIHSQLLEILNLLIPNIQQYIIINKRERNIIYSELSKRIFLRYYNNHGKEEDVYLFFELPEDFNFKGKLKIVNKKYDNNIIFECPIQELERVECGTNSYNFNKFKNNYLFFKPTLISDYCFILYFYKSYNILGTENCISLKLEENPSVEKRNYYVQNIQRLINSMKPIT